MKNPFCSTSTKRGILLLLAFIALLPIVGSTQITITSADFPHVGMLVVRDVDSTTAVVPGPAGMNQVWDFSNLITSYTDSTLYTLPDGLPGSENYPDANIVEKDMNYGSNMDGSYSNIFYQSTPTGWNALGEEIKISFWGISFYWHMYINPVVPDLPLPFTYNDTYSIETEYKTYQSVWVGGVQNDSSLVNWHLSVNMIADGSGTILTPTGSFEALRVKRHFSGIDTVFHYDPVAGWVYDEHNYSEFDTYTWYANGIGMVGSILDDGSKDGGSFSFYRSSTIVGNPEVPEKSPISIFPVPASRYLNIESCEQILKIEIYDSSGMLRLVQTNSSLVNLDGFIQGLYYIKISTSNGSTTRKFIKQ